MKKGLIIGIVVLVIIVISIAAWFFFFSGNNGGSAAVGGGNISPGSLPSTGTQTGSDNGSTGTGIGSTAPATTTSNIGTKFGVLSNEPVLDYFVDSQNNVTVIEPDGKIATILNGQASFLSSTEIEGLLSAAFSYDGKKIFVNFGDPANAQTSIFDITAKSWTALPAGISSPAWSHNDYRLAYLAHNANGSVSVVTLDTSKTTNKPVTLTTIAAQDLLLMWPNKSQIILQEKPTIFAEGSVWSFDLTKKTLSLVNGGDFGLTTIWSNTTSSEGLAYSSPYIGQVGALSLLTPGGTSTSQVLNPLTLPSKCAFNYEVPATSTAATTTVGSSTATSTITVQPKPYLALYCAIPQDRDTFSGAHLPDDYNQMAIFTSDNFYRIHTDNGATQVVFYPTQNLDGTDLKVFNGTLLFVNRYDTRLYAISLSQ